MFSACSVLVVGSKCPDSSFITACAAVEIERVIVKLETKMLLLTLKLNNATLHSALHLSVYFIRQMIMQVPNMMNKSIPVLSLSIWSHDRNSAIQNFD